MSLLLSRHEQGSDGWKAERNKYITGTDAIKLLRGESIQSILAAKSKTVFVGNKYTERGHKLEPIARKLTSKILKVGINEMPLITNPELHPQVGVSLDGMAEDNSFIWECKAFNEQRHLDLKNHTFVEIVAQIQWGLFVTGIEKAYLTGFNPDIKKEDAMFIKTLKADQRIHNKFRRALGLEEGK